MSLPLDEAVISARRIAAGPGPARSRGSRPEVTGELIRIEGEIRTLEDDQALWMHLVNDVGAVLPCAQAFVVRARPSAPRSWRLAHAASLPSVPDRSPLARWLGRLAGELQARGEGACAIDLLEFGEVEGLEDPGAVLSTMHHGLWMPMPDHAGRLGTAALLLAPEPWEAKDVVVAQRLAQAYAHAALAVRGRLLGSTWRERFLQRGRMIAAAMAAGLAATLAWVPVSLSTLAPVEVAPQQPFVVAAPVAGVVERVLVEPGAEVKAGEALVQIVDTSLRNEFEVAGQRLAVARARVLRVQQAAIDDPAAKRELAVAQTEQGVAQAERDFAEALLARSTLRAPVAGVALLGDARDWTGRPVAVGEAILRVADPAKAEFQLRVPVADAVNVRVGLPVQVFLDADPLEPRRAVVSRVAYKAEADAAGVASFLVTARADDMDPVAPQLGLRGTAQVQGERVSLFYYLFRRPLTAVRQTLGL